MGNFMKHSIFFVLPFVLFACKQTSEIKEQTKRDTLVANTPIASAAMKIDTLPETELEPFYIVQVATGYDFDSLKNLSSTVASILGSKVDMMERIYQPNKGIIVPDNSEDEIYRGEYYPRRPFGEQNFVSIEMSYGYEENETDTLKMVVFANISELKNKADSVTAILKGIIPSTKTVKHDLFLGCMH